METNSINYHLRCSKEVLLGLARIKAWYEKNDLLNIIIVIIIEISMFK